MSTPLQSAPGGRLTIDLAALAANWRTLAAISGPAETAAAVKADAYGLCVDVAVPTLLAAGCRTFFVALAAEGVRVRALAPAADIYVLGGYTGQTAPLYRAHRLRPVLGSPGEITDWLADGAGEPPALHIDSGINRLGLSLDEAQALAANPALVAALAPALVMSHFACADTPDHPLNAVQIARFAALRALFPGVPASLANSAGLAAFPESRHDLTRPGIALYGSDPLGGRIPVRPVVTLEARIIQVRDVAPGESVGYGAGFIAARPSRIAIVSVGYADGYPRILGVNGAFAAIEGRRIPLAGRVSMDLTALDVTDIPPSVATRGAYVELIGPTIPLDEIAARASTIPYEILTALGPRYERLTV